MTISDTSRTAGPFPGNGTTTDFPFSFKVFSRTDVLVAVTDTATGTETIKTIDADYSVALNSDKNSNPGGTVHMFVAPLAGTTLAMTSDIPVIQSLDLTNNGGFYPRAISDALDRIVINIQQLRAKVGIGTNVGASASVATVMNFIGTLAGGPGSSLVGFLLSLVGAKKRSVQDKLGDRPTVFDFMTDEERNNCFLRIGTVDVTAAIQKAFSVGVGTIPPGTYLVSKKLAPPVNIDIRGGGGRNTLFLVKSGFVDDSLFDLGSPTSPYSISSVSVSGLTIDLQNNVDAAMTCYGLQDGSTFDQVYIRGVRKYGVRTRWLVYGSYYLMNEGLHFNNVHVIGRNGGGVMSNGAYWDLSGLYESTLINCKALGFDLSGATHTNMTGFLIGGVNTPGLQDADSQGVRLYNCSAANFIGTGNRALFFGNAFHCSADAPTLENVQGTWIGFGQSATTGTVSDQYSAAYCYVDAPRLYNPAANPVVGATAFEFSGNAARCDVRNVPTMPSSLSGQKLARFLGNSQTCSAEVLAGDLDAATLASYIDFTSANPSNVVRIFSDSSSTKSACTFAPAKLYVERFSDGTVVTHTQFYTAVQLATDWRFCKNDGTVIGSFTASGTFNLSTAVLPTAGLGNSGTVWRDAANGNVLKIIP